MPGGQRPVPHRPLAYRGCHSAQERLGEDALDVFRLRSGRCISFVHLITVGCWLHKPLVGPVVTHGDRWGRRRNLGAGRWGLGGGSCGPDPAGTPAPEKRRRWRMCSAMGKLCAQGGKYSHQRREEKQGIVSSNRILQQLPGRGATMLEEGVGVRDSCEVPGLAPGLAAGASGCGGHADGWEEREGSCEGYEM